MTVPHAPTPRQPLRARDLRRARVAIYCRVSSDEQAQAGTIQNQVEFARRYCDLHQLPIAGLYTDEGVSGAVPLADRPAGARLLADAQAGQFGTVLVYRIDRLARATRVLLDAHDALQAGGVALRSMTEPFDTASPLGEFLMTLLGSLAALERATILERMTLGKHRAAREGRWAGGRPPYGYRLEGPEHARRLVVHPAEAAVVRRIFHLYVHEGLGLIPLAALLNAEGVPTPYAGRGTTTRRWPAQPRRWNTGTLSRLLRNTAYIGRYRAGARSGQAIAEYATPRLIDDETFYAAQRLLRERFVEASRNARRRYLLRGLIRCHCGRVAVGDGHRARQQFYYVCPKRHVRLRAEVLEAAIVGDIAAWARDPGPVLAQLRDQVRARLAEADHVAADLAAVREQLAAKQREQDAVITLYRKGRITEAQLDAQLDALQAEQAALEARQQALLDRQVTAQAHETALLSAETLLAQLRERADYLEHGAGEDADALRRRLIRLLVAGITVDAAGVPTVRYRFQPPADCPVHTSVCTELMTLTRPVALVTVPTAAARLGVSRTHLARLARAGAVPALRVTDTYLLPADVALPPRTCHGCGADLGRAKADRKWCDPCRRVRQRAVQRAAYARRRAGGE